MVATMVVVGGLFHALVDPLPYKVTDRSAEQESKCICAMLWPESMEISVNPLQLVRLRLVSARLPFWLKAGTSICKELMALGRFDSVRLARD